MLNPRVSVVKDKLDDELVDWIEHTFSQVFHYAPPPLTDSKAINDRDILMYHEFGGGWSLAEKKETTGLLGNKALKFETGNHPLRITS